MGDFLYQNGPESLIPARRREELVAYAEAITAELPEECQDCPAAYLCGVALNEDNGYGYPRTPSDVRRMTIRHGSGSYSMLSGQAQFALKGIVRDANSLTDPTGPTDDGTKCCLDPDQKIDIDTTDPYRI